MVHKLMAVLYKPLLPKGGERGPCENTTWFILVLNKVVLLDPFYYIIAYAVTYIACMCYRNRERLRCNGILIISKA